MRVSDDRRRSGLALAAVIAATAILVTFHAGAKPAPGPPADLAATGLYSDFGAKVIDPRHLAYSPQYPLWSDGATKRRWIFLPPGKKIDAVDPDVWSFPVGTKVWKEFSFGGRRVETRYMESTARDVWRLATYAWNADESAATLVPASGLRNAAEIRPGVRHDLPGVPDCRACHDDHRRTEVLGFSALQLSSDRDPNAPHAEPFEPGMVTLATLIERGLLKSVPPGWATTPPRIAGDPTARAALGYLHSNCGNCHNPAGALESVTVPLRHSVTPDASENTIATAVGRRTERFVIPGFAPEETFFIRVGDPARSAVLYRMATRDPNHQMPALGTKIVDAVAVDLIRRWIGDAPHVQPQRP
jgi:hypothetical protein